MLAVLGKLGSIVGKTTENTIIQIPFNSQWTKKKFQEKLWGLFTNALEGQSVVD